MFPSPEPFDLDCISRALSQRAGFTVQLLARTHSTNQVLLDEAASLTAQPTALLALAQSAGRGRRGRVWENAHPQQSAPAPAAHAFLGSVGVASTAPLAALSLLPLYVGVAVARCVQNWGIAARLKWPNDIWVDGAKLAGILVETAPITAITGNAAATAVVMGLGLNWTAAPQIAGKSVCCVADCLPTRPDPVQAAGDLIAALHRAYLDCTQGAALAFAAFDALRGVAICTDQGLQGRAVGINTQGHLGLHTAQGTHWLHSGEVSVQMQPQNLGQA